MGRRAQVPTVMASDTVASRQTAAMKMGRTGQIWKVDSSKFSGPKNLDAEVEMPEGESAVLIRHIQRHTLWTRVT